MRSAWGLLSTPLFILKVRHRRAFMEAAERLSGVIVDMGCGGLPYRELVSCERYWGFDMDCSPGSGPHVCADAQRMPVRSQSADAVICTEVLEHAPEPARVVAEAARILKPGGLFYLTAPMNWCLHYEPYDYWRFTPYGLRRLLEPQGFEIEWERRIGGLAALIGVRVADVAAGLVARLAGVAAPKRWAERVGAACVAPWSLFWHAIAWIVDRRCRCDALGWAMLARKRGGSDR